MLHFVRRSGVVGLRGDCGGEELNLGNVERMAYRSEWEDCKVI